MEASVINEKLPLFVRFHYIFYPDQVFNENHNDARQKAIDQLHRNAILESDFVAALVNIDGYIIFPPWVFPHASIDRLALVEQFYIMVWIVDDTYDTKKNFDENFRQAMVEVFGGDSCSADIINKLSDFQRMVVDFTKSTLSEIKKRSTSAWFDRFERDNRQWFDASLQSNLPKKAVTKISIDEYVERRVHDAGMLPVLDFVEFVHNRFLDDDVVSNPVFVKLRRIISEHTGIANDVYSYKKEYADGIVSSNFLLVVLANTSKTFDEAIQYAIQLCNDLIEVILPLEASLLNTYPDNEDLPIILKGYKQSVQGHMMFARTSPRYHSDQLLFSDMIKGIEEICGASTNGNIEHREC